MFRVFFNSFAHFLYCECVRRCIDADEALVAQYFCLNFIQILIGFLEFPDYLLGKGEYLFCFVVLSELSTSGAFVNEYPQNF